MSVGNKTKPYNGERTVDGFLEELCAKLEEYIETH